jgi:hypothetical protein
MRQNVGRNEQMARLIIGTVAGAASLRERGWQRAALCGVSTAAFLTGILRYCPMNAAFGINTTGALPGMSEHDLSVRNTEIRRETQTSAAMGVLPGTIEQPVPTA